MSTPQAHAVSLSVKNLLERATRGQLRLPAFQRPLKWTLKDNVLLLDSVARGFPIGTLLFWEKEMPAGRVVLGKVEFDAPQVQRAWLIIDGQQRVSALVGTMLRTGATADQFSIAYDLEEQRFHNASDGKRAGRSVPVSVLGAPERLLRWLEESGIRSRVADASDRAFRISTQLRDYEIAAYVVETTDESIVREVFDRLNTRGRKLTRSEVFEAIDRPERSGHSVGEVQRALENLRFGRIDKELILKSLVAVRGEDITQAFRPKWSREEREASWTRTLDGLRRAIVFLRRDGGVPHVSLLPYSLPLVILARFFSLHPEPHPRNRVLLARWLWRGFVHGTHQGQSIPLVRKMVAAVSPDEDGSVQGLLQLVPSDPSPHLVPEGKVSLKTARTRIEVLLLLRHGPRSFESGEPIDVLRVIEEHGPGGLLAEIVPGLLDRDGRSIINRFIVEGRRPKSLEGLPKEKLTAVRESQFMADAAGLLARRRAGDPAGEPGSPDEVFGDRIDQLSDLHALEDQLMGIHEPDRGPLRLESESESDE